jgi:hypothetical protein
MTVNERVSDFTVRPHEKGYRKEIQHEHCFRSLAVMQEETEYELLLETPHGMDILISDYSQNSRGI